MVKRNQIGLIAAWIYVFLIFVTSDSLMLFVSSAILSVGFFLCCSKHITLKLKGNTYFYIQLIFIAYCLFQLIVGIAVLKDISWATTRRLLINCVDEIMLFNILIKQKDIDDICKSLIYPFSVGLLLLIFLQYRAGTLFSHRLTSSTEDGIYYKFLGLTINAGVATLIGHCAVCAFAFCLICYYGNKKKKYLFFAAIASLGLVFTSSRKALVVAVALIIIIPELREHNIKKLLKMLAALAIIAVGCITIIRIPSLYNLVGARFERMFASLSTGEAIDSSMNVRNNLRIMALDAFKQRPITGWGINSFKELFNNGDIYSHCNYLELMVGTGIIGTLIFLAKYVYIFKESVNIIKMDELKKYYGKCLCVWLLMVWIMEFWQVAYYNERMIIHYIFVLAIIHKIQNSDTLSVTQNE